MKAKKRTIAYTALVILNFVVGMAVALLLVGSFHDIEGLDVFSKQLDSASQDIFLIYVTAGLLGAGLLTLLIYLVGLDPLRESRPYLLVYLNVLPFWTLVGILLSTFGELPFWVAGGVIALLAPLALILCELIAAKIFRRIGQKFYESGSTSTAYYCLKNSLRLRPSDKVTARQTGLLLAENGKFRQALELLKRVGAIEELEDIKVLRALENIYISLQENDHAFKVLQRQYQLNPNASGLDEKLLAQSLLVGANQQAIELLESGRITNDFERTTTLIELYAEEDRLGDAISSTKDLKRLEKRPWPQTLELLRQLNDQYPDKAELLKALGLLELESDAGDLPQATEHLERALALDPEQHEIRRILAEQYQKMMQNKRAESHFRTLIKLAVAEPDDYIGLAEVLHSEQDVLGACGVYAKLRHQKPEDWRGYYGEAELRFEADQIEHAYEIIERGKSFATDEARLKFNVLANQITQARERNRLATLTSDMQKEAVDPQKRLEYVRQLLTLNEVDRAIHECDAIIAESPELLGEIMGIFEKVVSADFEGFRARDYLSDLYFRESRYDDALQVYRDMAPHSMHPERILEDGYRRVLKRKPDFLPARLELAALYLEIEKWEGVLEIYKELVKNPPAEYSMQITRQWVVAAYFSGDLEGARDRGMELLPQVPDDLEFILMMIQLHERKKEFATAYAILTDARMTHPKDIVFRKMDAPLLDRKNRQRLEQLEDLNKKRGLKPLEHYEKADLHRKYEQIHEAIIHYQQASDEPEIQDLAMTKMAVCLCDRRLFNLADETLDEIELTKSKVKEHPELKNMYYWIADVLEHELYKDASLKYFRRLFRVDASFRDVVTRLELLEGA